MGGIKARIRDCRDILSRFIKWVFNPLNGESNQTLPTWHEKTHSRYLIEQLDNTFRIFNVLIPFLLFLISFTFNFDQIVLIFVLLPYFMTSSIYQWYINKSLIEKRFKIIKINTIITFIILNFLIIYYVLTDSQAFLFFHLMIIIVSFPVVGFFGNFYYKQIINPIRERMNLFGINSTNSDVSFTSIVYEDIEIDQVSIDNVNEIESLIIEAGKYIIVRDHLWVLDTQKRNYLKMIDNSLRSFIVFFNLIALVIAILSDSDIKVITFFVNLPILYFMLEYQKGINVFSIKKRVEIINQIAGYLSLSIILSIIFYLILIIDEIAKFGVLEYLILIPSIIIIFIICIISLKLLFEFFFFSLFRRIDKEGVNILNSDITLSVQYHHHSNPWNKNFILYYTFIFLGILFDLIKVSINSN